MDGGVAEFGTLDGTASEGATFEEETPFVLWQIISVLLCEYHGIYSDFKLELVSNIDADGYVLNEVVSAYFSTMKSMGLP